MNIVVCFPLLCRVCSGEETMLLWVNLHLYLRSSVLVMPVIRLQDSIQKELGAKVILLGSLS